jgi:hypothetical protein
MNKIMHQIATLAILVMMAFTATAQSGEIAGRVLNEKKQGEPFVTVVLVDDISGKNPNRAVKTNMDGYYSIKPLTPGKYNVMVRQLGYEIELQSDVQVSAGSKANVNFNLDKTKSTNLKETKIRAKKFEPPLVDKGETGTGTSMTGTEITKLADRNIGAIAASKGGVLVDDENKISIQGARSDGTQMIIDGVKVNGSGNIPPSAIGQIQVMTGGIDAKYGDFVGGVINITTKDPANKFAGSVDAITSHFLDNWSYNLANFTLSGPLIKKRDTTIPKADRKAILGYFLTGEFQYQRDRNPLFTGMQSVKDSVYSKLIAAPYKFSENGQNIIKSSELITANDLDTMAYHKNNDEYQARMQGKLNLKISDEFGLTFGGGFDKASYKSLVERYTLFNFDNNPVHDELTYRGFARFRHNIGADKQNSKSADVAPAKKVSVGNAYYTFQVDYEKVKNFKYDGDHKENVWNYGHVGKFERLRAQNVEYKQNEKIFFDSTNYLNMSGFVVNGDRDTGVIFTPGTINTLGASITSFYLDMVKDKNADKYYRTLGAIEQNGGLINGSRSNVFVHGLYHPYARQYNGYEVDRDDEQYRARLDASFDISTTGSGKENKHAIEFGLEYEQRVLRQYSIAPLALWRIASSEMNKHISRNPGEFNPTLHINDGKTIISLQDYIANLKAGNPQDPFYITDTIVYEKRANSATQTFFDKQLRSSLGKDVNGTEFINVDALDPSALNINMFAADELLSNYGVFQGNLNYQGYDIYGNRLTSTPSFKDFFTAKDANGNKTRLVDAFRPIYMAGYIQDKFQFEDLSFNVGLRIDRYDANQKVLKDKYSIYASKTINDLNADDVKKLGAAPSNLTSGATVYTDKVENPTKITGYRDGDFWYDPQGNLVSSPQSIISASGGNIQPYLLNSGQGSDRYNNIADSLYDPDVSFADYAPRVNVMPRLQFSFPLIKDDKGEAKSLFFAHYDILTQRPDVERSFASAKDWYLTFGKNVTTTINNPDLKTQTTIDFQMGFKQLLSKNTAVTISTFYREFRDQIQFTKVVGAFPKEYFTFGNIDFGTSKGIQIDYEMRPTATNNLRLKVGYTLGFAEGTGSDARTQFNIVQSGNNNFRLISALNYDARHNLTISADYRFGFGKDNNNAYNGPEGIWEKILQNFGVNIMANLRSGTPYTEQSNVSNQALLNPNIRSSTKGNVNTARLPSRTNINLKVDKSFVLKSKIVEGKVQKTYDFNVYIQIKNLFNTENVRSVYRFTGNAEDDGYISSQGGLIEIAAKNAELSGSGDSYRDLYKVALGMPLNDGSGRISNLAAPRTIQLGINFNF